MVLTVILVIMVSEEEKKTAICILHSFEILQWTHTTNTVSTIRIYFIIFSFKFFEPADTFTFNGKHPGKPMNNVYCCQNCKPCDSRVCNGGICM